MENKTILLLVFVLFLYCSCAEKQGLEEAKKDIINADIAFSNYSIENGVNKAFVAYAADSAVLLKPNRMPIVGKEEIIELHKGDDSQIVLTWKPVFADMAKSCDLGYTYGFWKLMTKNDSLLNEGTYLTIWKKEDDGTWKYVFDTGNAGLK